MDARSVYWYKLNEVIMNRCADGTITEEEAESILDEAQLMSDDLELKAYCRQQGIERDEDGHWKENEGEHGT